MSEWNDTNIPMLVVNDKTRRLPKNQRPPYVGGLRIHPTFKNVCLRRLVDGRDVIVMPGQWAILHLTSVDLYRQEEKR